MLKCIKWLEDLLLAWLGWKADRQEHVGEIKQQNADLKAQLSELKAEDEAARNTPHGKAAIIEALKHGELE